MDTWSTAHLPRRDRFEFWREERARRLFGVEAELDRDLRPDFRGRISVAPVGAASLIEVEVSSYAMRRTWRSIERAPDDSLYVRLCMRGSGFTLVGDDAVSVGGGTLSSGLSDVPYANVPDPARHDPAATVLYRAVRIPLSLVPGISDVRRQALDGLSARQHAGQTGLDILLRSYLETFAAQASHLTGTAATQAVRTLAQIALSARGLGDDRSEPAATAIREGLLARAKRLIERDLHRSDLDPARIAAELCISVRKLHHVFEPSGATFSRHVLARRLERADRLLASDPHLSVTEAAYASGFDGLSTFYRCYRVAYGCPPGERRNAPRSAR